MFTKFQLYLLGASIAAVPIIFAVCESQQRVSSQQLISSIFYSPPVAANTHPSSIREVTGRTLKADSGQPSPTSVDRVDDSVKAIPDSDYYTLEQAVTNFYSALDSIQRQIPATQDANGTATLIEAWTAANNNLAKVMDAFAKKHPQVTQGTLSPELSDITAGFPELNQKYASIPNGIGELAARFRNDPKIATAKKRLRQSLEFFDQ